MVALLFVRGCGPSSTYNDSLFHMMVYGKEKFFFEGGYISCFLFSCFLFSCCMFVINIFIPENCRNLTISNAELQKYDNLKLQKSDNFGLKCQICNKFFANSFIAFSLSEYGSSARYLIMSLNLEVGSLSSFSHSDFKNSYSTPLGSDSERMYF